MRIDLTCPVEIFRTEMPTAEIPAVSLTMYNLSDRVITSVEASVRLLNGAGAELEKMAFRGRALNGRPHSTFRMNVPMAKSPGVKSAEVRVNTVWFNDNDTWRRSDERSVEYDPNDLPVSTALTNLKFAAGDMAVGYPSQQDGLWICVCGRPNPDTETACARCRMQKAEVFARFSREAVEKDISLHTRQLDLTTRSARENTARLQRIREEEYNEKRSRRSRRLRLAACLAGCLALCAGLAFGAVPTVRSGVAAREIRSSDDPAVLLAAADFLRRDGRISNAVALADAADLHRARIALDAGDPAAARKAAAEVSADNEALKALQDDCLFAEGKALMENENWTKARDAFLDLGEYPGAAELANECLMNEAKGMLEAGNYAAAREAFLSLGDWPEASGLAKECLYRTAKGQMAEANYDEAIRTLSGIQDYTDSRRLTFECHYMKAAAYEAAGDIESAAGEYLMAGDWGDAQEKSRQTVYSLAENAFAGGDLAKAQGLYASIPGYLDADDKKCMCLYALGVDAYDDLEYTRAFELLSNLPEGYRDAENIRSDAAYRLGKNAYDREDYETAAQYLAAAGQSRSAEKLLVQVMKRLAAEQTAGQATPEPEKTEETAEPEKTKEPEKTENPERPDDPDDPDGIYTTDDFLVEDGD